MFCKTCGSLLLPKKTQYGKWMACTKGHAQPELKQNSETIKQKNIEKVKKVEVASDDNILAVHDHRCKKCGYDKAEMLHVGSFYSDEDEVVKMKCGRCGFVEILEGKFG